MDKESLRDNLFAKYFECKDGILATDLVNQLHFIPEIYAKLNEMCIGNVEMFDKFDRMKEVKAINFNNKKYLILRENIYSYIIIDMDKEENILNPAEIFDENFFISNFGERAIEPGITFYNFSKYEGNIPELIAFYLENKDVFDLSRNLSYVLSISSAVTRFSINFSEGRAQLAFWAPKQELYEQLFLQYDLSPSSMQDAQKKIGLERMLEMFQEVKKIKIPVEVVPDDLYQHFLTKKEMKQVVLTKKDIDD